jgi:hypothetical protein
MTTSRSLVFSVFLSGLVFSGATLLFTMMGSRPLTIELDDRPVFTGRVQDLATPYLGAVTGLSFGIGLTSFALLGWRDTSRRLEQATAQVSALKQQLQLQEGMVESLKFSEAKLRASGLNFFLDAPLNTAAPQAAANPALSESSLPVAFPQPAEVSSRQPVSVHAQAVETHSNTHAPSNHRPSQMEELVGSLKQIMNQIEQLQTAQATDRVS